MQIARLISPYILSTIGLCAVAIALLVLRHYGSKKTSFNPVVPTVL